MIVNWKMNKLELKLPPLLLFLLFGALMWAVSAFLPSPNLAFAGRMIVAGLLFIIGLATVLAGVLSFRRAETTVNPLAPEGAATVVRSGIYGHSRNPMYLGLLLGLLAWAVLLAHWGGYLLLPGFIMYMNRLQIIPEERILTEKFGADYRAYKVAVRRWL